MLRRLLLCGSLVVALSGALLNAAPSRAEDGPSFSVFADSVLNENGDGVWDDAIAWVHGNFDIAQWTLTGSSGETLAHGTLSSDQVSAARNLHGKGAAITVSEAALGVRLPAGEVTMMVDAKFVGGTSTLRSASIWVSHAPALAPMKPQEPIAYPRDSYPGVQHAATFRVPIPAALRARTSVSWQVVDGRGAVISGPHELAPNEKAIQWKGDSSLSAPEAAPGLYRVQLVLSSWLGRHELGPISLPVRLSHDFRDVRDVTTFQKAAATKVRTVTKKRATLRVAGGTLHYRSMGVGERRALVRTEHVVHVPRPQTVLPMALIKIEGDRACPFGFDLEMRGRDGRWHDVSVFAFLDRHRVWGIVPTRLIGPDRRFRFRVVWRGQNGTTSTMKRVGVQITKYVWRRG